jgi:O-antigen/teichoic acid export membrane protein
MYPVELCKIKVFLAFGCMGIVIRQSIYSTVISYIGVALGYITLLYLYPKYLQPEQIGLLRTIQDAAILFAPFAQFGLAQSIYRYYPQVAKDAKSQAGFLSMIFGLALVGFAIFLVVFLSFKETLLSYFQENANDIVEYTTVILWLTFILVATALLEAYSRSLLKTIFPSLLREVVIRALLGILVVGHFLGWMDYHTFIIATVLAYLFCLLLLIGYLMISGQLSWSTNWSLLPKPLFVEMMRYSFMSFAGTAGMIIIGKIDSLMVASLAGLKAVAVYTTAFYMASVIEIPKRALGQIAFPLIARAFEKNDLQDIRTIYRKTAINQFIIGSLLLIGVYINLDNIFELMPRKEVYQAGAWVVAIVGVGKLVDMLFGPSSEIIVLSRYYWFNMVLVLLLAAMVIAMNAWLIPQYGVNGAAAATAAALILFNIVKFAFIWFNLKMQPFSRATLMVLAIGLVTLALNALLPRAPWLLVDIAYRSAIVTVAFGTLILWSGASPDGNALIKNVTNWLRKKVH